MALFYSNCQSLLPATGAPISRHKANKMKEMFDEYVKERTKQNWKFWIVSFLLICFRRSFFFMRCAAKNQTYWKCCSEIPLQKFLMMDFIGLDAENISIGKNVCIESLFTSFAPRKDLMNEI